MPSDPSQLRASDEEREALGAEIRQHFAAGRLAAEELDERVQAVYQARTVAELQAVRSDLPLLPPSPQQRRAELAARRAGLQRRLLQQTGGALGVFLLCTMIWLASGADGQFWPVWVAIFPVIALLQNGWRLYGPAPELDRVERELDRSRRTEFDRGPRRELDRARRRRR